MRRKYEKPMFYMETLELDMPIAANCSDWGKGFVKDLIDLGVGENDLKAMEEWADKLCDMTSVAGLFTS